MALSKPYLDVPGTTIFDAEQSRKGYWLNQFCMSLMKPENRTRFKADERAYLDEWPMSEAQKQAVLARELNRCISLAVRNIYFLAKIGATDGKSFQQMAGSMTGMTEQEYRDMMIARRPLDRRQPPRRRGRRRAGAPPAPGRGRQGGGGLDDGTHHRFGLHQPHAGHRRGHRPEARRPSPYRVPLFKGYEYSKQWMQENPPDVIFLVYNDHATAFSLELIPTFAIGTASEFNVADEGYGPLAGAQGHRPSGAGQPTSRRA